MQRRNPKNYVQIDKYQVDFTQKLGEGGMASVYLGYYAPGYGDPETLFAVKQIPINAKFEVTDSLLQQINLLRKLNHPHIVRFIDARKSLDFMYLIMEYCNEGTLESLILNKRHEMTEEGVMKLFTQIVIALKFLQDKKIIHRDIKPKNILLHNGKVKIADFGVAKMIDKHKQNISFSGTVPFMSPQIIRQEKYTGLTDMWSLGVTFYFMMFKKLPWLAVHPVKILNEITIKINNGLVLPEENVSAVVGLLIEKMLVIEEESRLKWDELYEHEVIAKYRHSVIEDFDQNLEESTFETEEITLIQFLQIMQNRNYDELEKRGKDITQNYRASKIRNELGREAHRKLLNYKQHCIFFGRILDDLKYRQKSLVNRNLFLKCQFLLAKRCYILSRDLHQILSFSTHTQGVLIIPKAQFNELINDKKFHNSLKHIRNQVEMLYDNYKSQWTRSKQEFYKAWRTEENFQIIDRGDAYTESTTQTVNLITAFNDCFLELFLLLSLPLVQTYENNLHYQVKHSDIQLRFGINIYFVYDLIVILCFHNLNEKANFQSYYDKRKSASMQQIMYRIIVAHRRWGSTTKIHPQYN